MGGDVMRIEGKAAVALIATNLRRVLLRGLAVIALTSCGGGDDGGSCFFSPPPPPPRINAYPSTVATAGYLYRVGVGAAYTCWFLPLVPVTCGGFVALQLPAGARADDFGVSWIPSANQVNTDVQFAIATGRDICGHQATQSWTVHVYAPPVIESFTAERVFLLPGESAVLTAVFHGSGQIEGLGRVTSGVPITTPVLNTNTSFKLVVGNSVGADVHQALTIEVMATVTSANPAHGANEVPLNRALIATFSKKMDGATITSRTFLLRDGRNNPVMGTVTYADQIAIFAPANLLAVRSPYTATITDGVKDFAGNPMAGNYMWSFTTG